MAGVVREVHPRAQQQVVVEDFFLHYFLLLLLEVRMVFSVARDLSVSLLVFEGAVRNWDPDEHMAVRVAAAVARDHCDSAGCPVLRLGVMCGLQDLP